MVVSGPTELDLLVDGDEDTCSSSQDLDVLCSMNKKYNRIRVLSDIDSTKNISITAVFGSPVLCSDSAVFLSKRDFHASGQSCSIFIDNEGGTVGSIDTRCRYKMYCDSSKAFCYIYILATVASQSFSLCEIVLDQLL